MFNAILKLLFTYVEEYLVITASRELIHYIIKGRNVYRLGNIVTVFIIWICTGLEVDTVIMNSLRTPSREEATKNESWDSSNSWIYFAFEIVEKSCTDLPVAVGSPGHCSVSLFRRPNAALHFRHEGVFQAVQERPFAPDYRRRWLLLLRVSKSLRLWPAGRVSTGWVKQSSRPCLIFTPHVLLVLHQTWTNRSCYLGSRGCIPLYSEHIVFCIWRCLNIACQIIFSNTMNKNYTIYAIFNFCKILWKFLSRLCCE